MTIWACARQGEPTTYHDTESGALAHAALIVGGPGNRECVVYPVEVEGAQEAARLAETGHSGANGVEGHLGATEGIRELETGDSGEAA